MMPPIQTLALCLAAASSLALAVLALVRPPTGRLRVTFSLGMAALGIEALAALVLVAATETPEHRRLGLTIVLAAGAVVLLPWCAFAAALAGRSAGVLGAWRRPVTAVGAGLLLASAASLVVAAPVTVPDVPGPFEAAGLRWSGQVALAIQLAVTVVILAALEGTLRASQALGRWRVKYLIVGLGAVFLVRFYVLSLVLLFQTVTMSNVVTVAGTLALGNVVIGAALARKRLTSADLAVSRQFVLRSVVAAILGSYLLAVAGIAWIAPRLDVPDALVWVSLVICASAIGLAVLLLSESLRWRVRQLIGRHFYETKYDYREQWTAFTRRLGSLLTIDELAPEILRAVTDAVGATRGALYLADPPGAVFHLATSLGLEGRVPAQLPAGLVPGRRRGAPRPARLAELSGATGLDPDGTLADLELIVPLAWQARTVAVILIGPERTGVPYTAEDFAFLGTVAQQAAGAIVTTQLSEAAARTREFEAFHRFTSFVLHDIKNAVSALSLLSRNAMDHFDDPQFQRDAIKTLSRTVHRMNDLIQKLGAARDPEPVALVEVDLAALLRETVSPLVAGREVTVVADLDPVPPVLGDVDALARVVENLVTNALDAMGGEGQLRLRTEIRGDLVSCSIADTGRGMPPEFVRRSLFVPFRSTKPRGWGIGLFQAREIIAAFEGRLDISSAPGRGTTVTLLLPAATGPALAADPSAGMATTPVRA